MTDETKPTIARSAATWPWKAERPARVSLACTRLRLSLTGRSMWT